MIQPQEFAILPWDFPSGDDEVYTQLVQCGFNLAGFVTPGQLETVHQAGLQCLVYDPAIHVSEYPSNLDEHEIMQRVQSVVGQVGNHPAVFGYYLRDEPSAELYPDLAKWVKAFNQVAPHSLPYINLYPIYADLKRLGTETYQQYLDAFIETVHPRFISYDHYALMDDGIVRGGYFQNLEVIRSTAQRSNLPFWNIVLSNAHFRYTEPTPATLRFQLFTTLAYGARGIGYFTYFAPPIGNYRLAPIDQFGHKTPTWDMLRNVNLQLHQILPTYLKLKSIQVFHYPDAPEGCASLESSRLVKAISGKDLLVGEFENEAGQGYALVVNKNLHYSTRFDIALKSNEPLRMINPYTGNPEAWAGENNWLAPGQGMLLF